MIPSLLSLLHPVARSDILSEVPSVSGRDGGPMEPSLGCVVGDERQGNNGGEYLLSFMVLAL
jgi:hypothetical protein